jgi:rhamnose transport system permease protein
VKNSQVAVLSLAILAAAGLVAASNWLLVKSLGVGSAAPAVHGTVAASPRPGSSGKRLVVGMMPKSKGNAYFIACQTGANEAAKELGVELLWDGPTSPDPAGQNAVVEGWITRGVDVIAVAVENRDGISSVLRKARERGIKVVTWDSDAQNDARDFFVNQATPEGIGETLMDHCGRLLGGKGEYAIITASLTAANMIEWQKQIAKFNAQKFPDVKMVALRPCDDKQPKAFDEATAIMNANPNCKLLMAICSPAVPGAAEAVKQAGRKDVMVIGLGLPNDNKRYLKDGTTKAVVLWKTADLGYLSVHAARAVAAGDLKSGATEIVAGRLGAIKIDDKGSIVLGAPFTFTKENVDQFDF